MSVRLALTAASGGLMLALAGCTAPPDVACPVPPALTAEVMPLPPVSEQALTWRPGHWDWTGSNFVWTPGAWVANAGGTTWVAGAFTYTPAANACTWIPGHFIR